ncbi:MAG TPA: histidine kinase [Streptosporangiaceae bacterium]|jgi:signal transduction histidine kinase
MTSRTRLAPWTPRSWRQALYLAGGIPAQLLALVLIIGWQPKVWRDYHDSPVWPQSWGKPWWLPLLFLVVVFFSVPLLTRMHRQRLGATTGTLIPPQPARRGIVEQFRSRATWRQLGYHLLAGPALAVAAAAAVSCWIAGATCALVYTYSWKLGQQAVLYRGIGSPRSLPRVLDVPVDAYLTVAGFLLLAVAPWLTAGVAGLDARIARATLGPSRAEELEVRVEQLAQTRAGAVDAADTERRRLERDLHDGTQQRLVALAMNLGMARAGTNTVEQAHEAIAEAHEEAKAALTELRNLVRGLHPPVLEDRGLDAALSGIAARMPIPVRLTVDVPRRPPAMIEAVAYFVVSEGLTNITKHAQASQAEVVVQRAGDRLHVIISDDGAGGADPAYGTGLTGLAKRVASVDGTFEIDSPSGGPTLLTVDLPCAR